MKRIGSMLATISALTGVALLRDMFSSVNNRVNGFERNLRTNRYTRSMVDRAHSTDFSGRQHGARERTRRMRQIAAGTLTASNGLVRGANFPKVNSHGRVERGR